MFSPKVLKRGPWTLRTLITRFVKGVEGDDGPTAAVVEATMYCSFSTSCITSQPSAKHFFDRAGWMYQNAYHGIVVRVVNVIRVRLD